MKIIDISHLDVETMQYVVDKPNTFVYRKIKKLETRSPATPKEIPWYNDEGSLEVAMNFKSSKNAAFTLMICSFTLAKMFGGKIKWPNDVILAGKKASGMSIIAKQDHFIFGSGINLNRTKFNQEISEKAISYINHYNKKWDELDFVTTFVKNLFINFETVSIKDIEDMQVFKNKKMKINNKVYQFISLNNDGSANWLIDGKKETFNSYALSFTKHYHLFAK